VSAVILLDRAHTSKRAVLEEIGEVMLHTGAVTPKYVNGMLRKEEEASTVIMPEVALPHGTSDVRDAVLDNILVFVQVPRGVDWGNGALVRLAIGLAGRGDEMHVRMLSGLARVLTDPDTVARLKFTADAEEARRLLMPASIPGGV
jgi:PTS system mannitol-specific IIA component